MSMVLLDMVMSLDGFIAGLNGEDAGLHDWHVSPVGKTIRVIEEQISTIGAIVIGRRTYDLGAGSEAFKNHPVPVPHFVLTHEPPHVVAEGVPFTFVTDGMKSAIRQAKVAAGGKVVAVGGGASNAQQSLRTGLVDEIQIHLVPVLVGEGIRLFDSIGTGPIELECTRVIESPGVIHLKYRVIK